MDNVVPCCFACNAMKSTVDARAFVEQLHSRGETSAPNRGGGVGHGPVPQD